ncbi:MAG: outer membrane lipoprotein-sorting protein [Bacteroidetes bacterium GWF2_42_66]|nr:MAG: outer membrane lipoprotein-sorting protein [Bacteroidetes bacterium GWA2_42_15]OFY00264.1 MAG: outer membrane lipoprotein-sorting protein [Bacteroidetes bacterium GWE2_42_39]OFY47165.1 MAG: outer membrane lipoprotein-sorting protein [Bacteroidetes bacterium GWF2_42_66]HBL76644.1 outer membrane lipoprotein-sorting protein [Prolixibacteraceae bacterium]HCR89825.1 outer membrane lipoprotein-sorting protein [Prolixibacteraceae bacterium]
MKCKLIILLFFASFSVFAQQVDVKALVREADEKMRGNSSTGTFSMTIERPGWSRTISMKSWSLGTEYSLICITAPAKEKGQVFLKRQNEMWNWIPSIERMVKIPPSMMMQSWMGSDFTNDDLVKESSLIKDYTHQLLGEEKIQGYDCYKIEMTPTENAPVVWGKVIMWVSKKDKLWLKAEYYDEDGFMVNYEIFSDIKKLDDRIIPCRMEMVPADKEGHKTIMIFEAMDFEVPLKEDFFSIQNMKKVK